MPSAHFCGAAGYWMKNGSPENCGAVGNFARREIYITPAVTAVAVEQFARRGDLPPGLDALSDREVAVFALIASEHGCGQIAKDARH